MELPWSRQTPGMFEVYADDLEELRDNPGAVADIGSCEWNEFSAMNLPDLAALGKLIIRLYDTYGEDSEFTSSRLIDKDELVEDENGFDSIETVSHLFICFNCRAYLKPEWQSVPYH